jgi:hypothetical protein
MSVDTLIVVLFLVTAGMIAVMAIIGYGRKRTG